MNARIQTWAICIFSPFEMEGLSEWGVEGEVGWWGGGLGITKSSIRGGAIRIWDSKGLFPHSMTKIAPFLETHLY